MIDFEDPEILKWLAENPTPKGHKALTQRCWENIRRGLERCQQNQKDLQACLESCQKKDRIGGAAWARILTDKEPDRLKEVFTIDDFFDLPREGMTWWENVVQNHPFAVLFAQERFDGMPKAMQDEIKKLL